MGTSDPARNLPACRILAPDLTAAELAAILLDLTGEDALVRDALEIATQAHRTHTRDEGAPYIVHPLRVSLALQRTGSPPHVIAAALCHDVFEDAPAFSRAVVALGRRVADLVEALTDDWYEDYYAKIIASREDACRIKISDRADNLRFLHFTGVGKQARYVRETARQFPMVIERANSPELAGALQALLEWHVNRANDVRATQAAQMTRQDSRPL